MLENPPRVNKHTKKLIFACTTPAGFHKESIEVSRFRLLETSCRLEGSHNIARRFG